MSIRRTSIDRLNEARKSGRPTIGKGKPLNAQGDDGDLTFRRTSDGLKLYIKAAGKWNGVKVGESFDDLEKSLNNLQKIVSTIKKFRLPSTYSVTGDFTLDASGDITLNADGGQVHIKDGAASHFTFDCDNTRFRIFDDTDSADFCNISVGISGATIISTTDDGAAVGHLSLIPDGNLILDPVSHIIQVLDNTVGFTQTEPAFHATDTIVDFSITGNKQKLTLTNNVTDVHFRFPAMSGNFICVILQDGSGSRTVSNWKSNSSDGTERTLLWAGGTAPANTETADKADIASFYWDADNNIAYGVYTYNF